MSRNNPAASWFAAVVLLIGLVAAPSPSQSQDERVSVRLDGRVLFQVGQGDADSAAERARRVEQRLETLLESENAIQAAVIHQGPGDRRTVSVTGVPVVTVTLEDAQDNVTTPERLAAQWAAAIDTALERGRDRRLSFGGRFLAETQASVESAFSRLLESVIHIVPRALAALVVITLFWLFARLLRWGMRALFRRFVEDETTESLIKQIVYYAIVGLGLIVAVDALGFEPETVVTGLGLTGLALGFALKDIISNFVSGILILSLRPFDLGDQIVVGSTEGSVERIELRATQIRTYDGRIALVPNAELFTSRIINNTAHPIRRGSVELSLGYGEDLDRAIRAVLAAVPQSQGVSPDRLRAVRVKALGPDDMILEATFWTDSRRSDFNDTASHVRQSIVAAFKDHGIGLPDPDRRVVEHHDRGAAERGVD